MNDISISAYPDPFPAGSKINISMHLKDRSEAELSVYNILGQKITTVLRISEVQDQINLKAGLRNLSTGMYFLFLKTGMA